MKDILDLHVALQKAGLDISGVCDPGPQARITGWNTGPTQADLDKASLILKSFDWTDPVPVDVEAQVARLTPAQKQRLLDLSVVEVAKANPKLLGML
jgi:hypothetical protein